ncbi:peptidoglycan amidohydrolase family protein [Enterococcus sp. AZ109]|uniref:peptidoglycan amidohydrolase family protein n=1 Tax=Enterococcus sp. AZ109 TaxID=2774634 RepID=UPI003F25B5C4
MASIENMIKWMTDRQGKVTYSMARRTGPNSYDCSSAVSYAMAAGGFYSFSYPGSTETLFGLNGTILKKISRSECRRGDIFIAGTPGYSLGSGGHTGIFLDNKRFIHCNYTANGISVNSNDAYMGTRLQHHFYRIVASGSQPSGGISQPQQLLLAIDGSWGPATTRRLQEVLDTAGKDGIISGQIRNRANRNIPSVQFGTGGSNVIRALQNKLGVAADGNFGPTTCRALQQRMGTIQDGEISPVSDCVKEMQRRLNENKI